MKHNMENEIESLMLGIDLSTTLDNGGLNQLRNIVNALDNVLMQMNGAHSPFQPMVQKMRDHHFQTLVSAARILETQP